MADSHLLNSRLNTLFDINDALCDFMNLVDLVQLQEAYPTFASDHIDHVRRRIFHFTKALGDPKVIRNMMRATRSVFSGSFFLAVFCPELLEHVRDLDLYVARGFVPTWVTHLLSTGFTVVIPAPVDGEQAEPAYTNGIASVTRLVKGNIFIDIIESETSSALTVVLNHHSTPVTRPSPPFDPN